MDFLDKARLYTQQFSSVQVEVGTLRNGNSVAIRPTPSQGSSKYLENSKIYTFNFQILVRNTDNRAAYDLMQHLEHKWDALENGAILSDDFQLIKCDVTTTTNWVERDSQGSIYTALFSAELYIKKDGE